MARVEEPQVTSPVPVGVPGSSGAAGLPDGLPPIPPRSLDRRSPPARAAAFVAVAAAPLVLMLVSVLVGGGPRAESADDALITLASRDAVGGHVLLGPYSRFGWHHPGPSYFYLLSFPAWIWHHTPTGSWVGATTIGVASLVGMALLVRRWAGVRAGWWSAAAALAVVAGVGPGVFRDPWNPYVVALPLLFVGVSCALAAAGVRGTLIWAGAVGSFAVQTHVSTMPLVACLLAIAVGAQLVRRWRAGPPAPAPGVGGLGPGAGGPAGDVPWWRYRPDLAVAVMVLVAEWAPPVWDQFFGTGNLGKLATFFTSGHSTHAWASSWRQVCAVLGITVFQHHAALQDGVADPHPVLTTLAFVAVAAVAIGLGAARRRPIAVWLGAFGLVGFGVAVVSVTRIVGGQYRYLMVWMAVLPALPLIGAALALEGIWSDLEPTPRWARPGTAATLVSVTFLSVLGVRAAQHATPAAALTDPDIVTGWDLIAPVVGTGHQAVRLDIADGARWPAAAGIGLDLERSGHPVRVDRPWTLLFGDNRRATGSEPIQLILTTSDTRQWPPADVATRLGQAGPTWWWVVRAGDACWWGWVPFGGPACPTAVAPSGPAVPLPPGSA